MLCAMLLAVGCCPKHDMQLNQPETEYPLTAFDIYYLRPLGYQYVTNIVPLSAPLIDTDGWIRIASPACSSNGLLGKSRDITVSASGNISPYDNLFRRYAPDIEWDWRLLAALVYHESRFDPDTESHKGAAGLMQLMPRTAGQFGLDTANTADPEANIAAGVRYIAYLQAMYRHIPYQVERTKFVLASYNAGPGHIQDAMRLAAKHGYNPHVWYDNVEYFLSRKSDPVFYRDSVVRYGHFNSRTTQTYVNNVLGTYHAYRNH